MLDRLKRLDPLIVLIVLAVIVAIILPARGTFAEWFQIATNIAIALLFFLYGARLSTREALNGLTHWKLHLTILVFTFVVYPIIGLVLKPALTPFISDDLYRGILFLMLVPSTVQSSVAFTSIAKGNVAGSIVAASASSLVGVVATPLLVMLLLTSGSDSGSGITIDTSVFVNIAVLLLLPFILGQVTRKWTKKLAASSATKVVDRGSITMVVYSAFSSGMVSGVWGEVSVWEIIFLVVFSIVFVIFMLWLTRFVSSKLGFSRKDVIAIEFCGSKKSLATGLPMATIMFGGASLGLLILPLMIYHQVQLMICAWLAARYGQQHV